MGDKQSKHQSPAGTPNVPPSDAYTYNQRQQPPPPPATQRHDHLHVIHPSAALNTTPLSTTTPNHHQLIPPPLPSKSKALSSIGIGAVLERQQFQQQHAQHTMNEAFIDLQGLMRYAKDVVELADKYIATKQRRDRKIQLQQQQAGGGDTNGDVNDSHADNEFHEMLTSMGIPDPVTKDSAGSSFHMDLCKELARDVLPKVLPTMQSMITLTDLYCIYNRARGTELIAPNDLRTAVSMLDYLKLPYRMKKFQNNGVLVIMHRQYTENDMCESIMKLLNSNDTFKDIQQKHPHASITSDDNLFLQYNTDIQNDDGVDGITSASASASKSPLPSFASTSASNDSPYPYITAIQVSAVLNISLLLAKQQLALCEQRQLLCCDETIDQIRYYNNEFLYPSANKLYSTSFRR